MISETVIEAIVNENLQVNQFFISLINQCSIVYAN